MASLQFIEPAGTITSTPVSSGLLQSRLSTATSSGLRSVREVSERSQYP